MVGTIGDYARFCQMLMNLGELEGERLLAPTTVKYMRTNHLPNNSDMAAMGQPVWSETSYDGIGFGLGFAVVLDQSKSQLSPRWASTTGGSGEYVFWIDPRGRFVRDFSPSSVLLPLTHSARVTGPGLSSPDRGLG